jgi:hypothetical protein
VPNPHLWTPDDPYLYDLKVRLLNPVGKAVDESGIGVTRCGGRECGFALLSFRGVGPGRATRR